MCQANGTRSVILKIALFLILVSDFSSASAAVFVDGKLKWKTIETDHFYIHFVDRTNALAYEAAVVAEQVHADLSSKMGWEPVHRTHLILSDQKDFANGWAKVLPQNTIYIIVTPPDDISGLSDYRDALDQLITHEYTHIIHMDKVEGIPAWFRSVFGRFRIFGQIPFVFPNSFNPEWFIEGLAQYEETDIDYGVGRGQSTYYRMLMRMEVMQGLKPLDKVSQPVSEWPAGSTSYLYGIHFFNFIRDNYGEEKIYEWIDWYSSNVIPYRLDSASSEIFGKGIHELWEDYEAWLNEKFQAEIAQIKQQGVVEGEQLTEEGGYSGVCDCENNQLSYLVNDFNNPVKLFQQLSDGSREEVASAIRSNRFDVHPEKGVLLVINTPHRNASTFADIYRYDPKTQTMNRLTEAGRYRFALWSEDGKHIYAIKNAHGNSAIHRLNEDGTLDEVLWRGYLREVISSPDLSPDETRLVASVWRQGGSWGLEEFDLKSRQWNLLTQNAFIEAQPRYTKDGEGIVYSADYDGVFNIYYRNRNNQKTVRLTRVLTGAFNPCLDQTTNTLYYRGMNESGSDLYKIASVSAIEETAVPQKTNIKPINRFPRGWGGLPSEDYSGLKHLVAGWWLPSVTVDDYRNEYGLKVAAADPLGYHFYSLFAAYDFQNDWLVGSARYLNDYYPVAFSLFFSRSYDILGQNNHVYMRESLAGMDLILPFRQLERDWEVRMGVSGEYDEEIGSSNAGREFKDQVIGIALRYQSTQTYPYSISPANGSWMEFLVESSNVLDSDYSGVVTKLDLRHYWQIYDEHTIAGRLVLGLGGDETRRFALGGNWMNTPELYASGTIFNLRDYPLRGYPESLYSLRGQRMALGSLEWRTPLFRIERSALPLPVGLGRIHATLFADAGSVWSKGESAEEIKTSAGIEINGSLYIGYNGDIPFRLGFANGFDEGGDSEVYLTIGSRF